MADFRRNFSDAARRYIQLSYDPAIHRDERVESLKHAMICAILSPAGKQSFISFLASWLAFSFIRKVLTSLRCGGVDFDPLYIEGFHENVSPVGYGLLVSLFASIF